MQTYNAVLQWNMDDDIKELKAYKDWYVSQAALAKDAGKDKVSDAYLDAAVQLERCIQGLSTIPMLDRTT